MAVVGDGGGFEADVEEMRAAGRAVIAVGDDVEALSRDEILGARGVYGSWVLADAAERFSLRYSHLVETVAREVVHAGDILRDSAGRYRTIDDDVPVVHVADGGRGAGSGWGPV